MNNDLVSELKAWLAAILQKPRVHCHNPYYAEQQIRTLVVVLCAMESTESLFVCQRRVDKKIDELTEAIPALPSQYLFLCEQMAWPNRVADFSILVDRSRALCTSLGIELPPGS